MTIWWLALARQSRQSRALLPRRVEGEADPFLHGTVAGDNEVGDPVSANDRLVEVCRRADRPVPAGAFRWVPTVLTGGGVCSAMVRFPNLSYNWNYQASFTPPIILARRPLMTLNTAVNNPQLVPLPGLRPCRSCALPTRLSPPPWRPSSPPTPALTFTFCRSVSGW